MSEIPEEIYELADGMGIARADVERIMRTTEKTPRLPVRFFAVNGQEAGEATLRIGREYDQDAVEFGCPGLCLVLMDAPAVEGRFAFWVDRKELLAQLAEDV